MINLHSIFPNTDFVIYFRYPENSNEHRDVLFALQKPRELTIRFYLIIKVVFSHPFRFLYFCIFCAKNIV